MGRRRGDKALVGVLRGLLLIAAAAAVLTVAGTASAGVPSASMTVTYRCHGTAVDGQTWAIRQSNTNCAFARYAVRVAVEKRRSPKRWRCYIDQAGEFGPERRDYRVRCYRGTKRVLGVAQR